MCWGHAYHFPWAGMVAVENESPPYVSPTRALLRTKPILKSDESYVFPIGSGYSATKYMLEWEDNSASGIIEYHSCCYGHQIFWNAPLKLRAGSTPTPFRTRLSTESFKDLSFHVRPSPLPALTNCLRIVSIQSIPVKPLTAKDPCLGAGELLW